MLYLFKRPLYNHDIKKKRLLLRKVFYNKVISKIQKFVYTCCRHISYKNVSIIVPLWIAFVGKVICLFAWVIFVPLESFSLIWRFHPYRWREANFDLCSALKAIEQWGFFCVPHLLCGTFVYNGHLRGCAVDLSLHVLRPRSVVTGILIPNLPHAK